MDETSWSARPILARIALAIDFLTSRITSCFFRSDCARGGAFLNSELADRPPATKTASQGVLEKFNDCRFGSLANGTVRIFKAGHQARYICTE